MPILAVATVAVIFSSINSWFYFNIVFYLSIFSSGFLTVSEFYIIVFKVRIISKVRGTLAEHLRLLFISVYVFKDTEQIFRLVWIIVTGDSVYFLLLLNDVIYIVNEYDIASIYFYALIVFTCRYLEDNFNYLQAIVISYCLSQFLVTNNEQVKSSLWSITLLMPLSLFISPTNIKKPLVF